MNRFDVAPGGSSTDMIPASDGAWVRFEDIGVPLSEDFLRALIERECGPVMRIGNLLWAIEVAQAVERAHGIGPNVRAEAEHTAPRCTNTE